MERNRELDNLSLEELEAKLNGLDIQFDNLEGLIEGLPRYVQVDGTYYNLHMYYDPARNGWMFVYGGATNKLLWASSQEGVRSAAIKFAVTLYTAARNSDHPMYKVFARAVEERRGQ